MSLRDKVTDKLIEELRSDTYAAGLVDKDEAEDLAGKFNRLTALADAPFGAQRMLGFAVAAEVLALAMVMFGMRYLLRIFGDVYVVVFGIVFVFLIGFFAAFAAYKLYKEYIARDSDLYLNDGPMSDIAGYYDSQSNFALYLISAAGGVANTVVVLMLLSVKF